VTEQRALRACSSLEVCEAFEPCCAFATAHVVRREQRAPHCFELERELPVDRLCLCDCLVDQAVDPVSVRLREHVRPAEL